MQVKIVRQSGKSLFIKLPSDSGFSIGGVVTISLTFSGHKITYVGLIKAYHDSYGIHLPTLLVKRFEIKCGDYVDINYVRKAENLERTAELFKNGMIDLLSLIPECDRKNKIIYVENFVKDNEEFLRIWSKNVKVRLELRRYIDIRMFGNVLGQLQAEGAKFENGKTPYIYFSNVLINEHKDFINGLRKLDISEGLFYVQCRYDSNSISENEVKVVSSQFTNLTCVKIKDYFKKRNKGSIDFYTYVMSSLLGEILLTSMHKVRKLLTMSKLDGNLKILAENFLIKLLNGDGTFKLTYVNSIRRHIFQGNISDKNLEYRQDYLQILKNLGFNARDDKVVAVYFSCRIPDLLYLYSISAFKGTGNWERLLKAIGMITTRKTSYGRSLFRLTEFSDNPLRANPVYTKENFRQWIYRMSKNGYIEKDGITLTAKAHNLIEIFNRWKNDFKTLET